MKSNLNKSDYWFSLERNYVITSGRQFGKQLSNRKMLELLIEHTNFIEKSGGSLPDCMTNEFLVIDSLAHLDENAKIEEMHFYHPYEKNGKAEYKKSPLHKLKSRADKTAKPSTLLMKLTGGVK